MTATPELVALHKDEPEVIVRLMLTFDRAADDHLGDCARRGFRPRTLTTYRRTYDLLADRLPDDQDVSKITTDDLRRFLNAHSRLAPGTIAGFESHLASLFRALYVDGKIPRDPMDKVVRTRRKRPEDLDVVTVSTDDIRRLLRAATTWQERLAIGILCLLGSRRHAVAMLRLGDYDELRKRLRFYEKGGKTIWKPVPGEIANLIAAAVTAGVYTDSLEFLADSDHSGNPYLIPPGAKLQKIDRDDRVIWDTVKRVAARAGVHAHVHALRAGFAVAYLERERDLIGLQELLGHASPETTRTYLRKLDRQQAMEPVRTFSYGVSLLDNEADQGGVPQTRTATGNSAYTGLDEGPNMGAGGFEPPQAEPDAAMRPQRLSVESDLLGEARNAVPEPNPQPEVEA